MKIKKSDYSVVFMEEEVKMLAILLAEVDLYKCSQREKNLIKKVRDHKELLKQRWFTDWI